MSTFLERLVVEHNELLDKSTKLDTYISSNDHFNTLDETNKNLLVNQLDVMKQYLNILSKRIEINK